jgi:hypothetical protein
VVLVNGGALPPVGRGISEEPFRFGPRLLRRPPSRHQLGGAEIEMEPDLIVDIGCDGFGPTDR